MNDVIEIIFEDFGLNSKKFLIIDHRDKRTWTDHVRINDDKQIGNWPARESLSIYGFWMDILDFIGSDTTRKPTLQCNDTTLLTKYYKTWCKYIGRQTPWPFCNQQP
jgi:hypothetical protein